MACLVPHYRIITFNLYGKALAALATTAADDAAAVLGGHARTETVGAFPLDVRRLVSALHAMLLLNLTLKIDDSRQKPGPSGNRHGPPVPVPKIELRA